MPQKIRNTCFRAVGAHCVLNFARILTLTHCGIATSNDADDQLMNNPG